MLLSYLPPWTSWSSFCRHEGKFYRGEDCFSLRGKWRGSGMEWACIGLCSTLGVSMSTSRISVWEETENKSVCSQRSLLLFIIPGHWVFYIMMEWGGDMFYDMCSFSVKKILLGFPDCLRPHGRRQILVCVCLCGGGRKEMSGACRNECSGAWSVLSYFAPVTFISEA